MTDMRKPGSEGTQEEDGIVVAGGEGAVMVEEGGDGLGTVVRVEGSGWSQQWWWQPEEEGCQERKSCTSGNVGEDRPRSRWRRWWWVRDGGRRGRHRLATSMVAVAARRRIRRREEELHIGKRQGSETMVQAEEDGDWSGIVVGE